MNQMEEFLHGGAGIDTQVERDILNYRPHFELTRKSTSGLHKLIEEGKIDTEDLTELPTTDVYVEISDVYDYLQDLVNQMEDTMKHNYIPVDSKYIQKILESPADIEGLDKIDLEKGIPFELYEKTFHLPEHPTMQMIQDAVEEFAQDINGNIVLELYPDAKQMLLNTEELHYLLRKTLYNQLVEEGQVPTTPAFNEVFYDALKEKEEKQLEAFTTLKELHQLNETIYYSLLTSAYETEDYFKALEHFNSSKRDYEVFQRQINEQREMSSFGSIDIGMTDKCAKAIGVQVEADPYLDEEMVGAMVRKQYEKPEQYQKACTQLQAVMKLQVNNQIEEKQKKNDVLKNTGGISLKKRVHDEVIHLVNIRNDVFLDLYDMMNNMVEPTRLRRVERFFNQIGEGMEVVRSNYKDYLGEMYQVHMLDQEVRMDKVELVQNKEMAREGYWLIDNLTK